MNDQQAPNGTPEPSWLDQAVETLDRIRAANVVDADDIVSVGIARDGIRIHVFSGARVHPATVAARLGLNIHGERRVKDGTHHTWEGVASNGTVVSVVTHIWDKAVAS